MVFGEVAATAKALASSSRPELQAMASRLSDALQAWVKATECLAADAKNGLAGPLTVAVPYLHLAVTVCGGWFMGKAALAAAGYLDKGEGDQTFYRAKIATARFYADQMLPQAAAYGETVRAGATALAEVSDEFF